MAKKNRQLESRALGMIADEPEFFKIKDSKGDEHTLKFYPLQLGRLAMISKRLLALDMVFDGEEDDVQQMWRICSERAQEVAEIIAIATLRTKEEIDKDFDDRVNLLLWSPSMTVEAYVHVMMFIVAQSYFGDFMKAIRSVRMLRINIADETTADRIAPMGGRPFGAK